MMSFDNGILAPPIKLMEYYLMNPKKVPTHFMRSTAPEVWGDNDFKTMQSSAAAWVWDDDS